MNDANSGVLPEICWLGNLIGAPHPQVIPKRWLRLLFISASSSSPTYPFSKEIPLVFKVGSVYSWESAKMFDEVLREPSFRASISICFFFFLKLIHLRKYPWWEQQASLARLPFLSPPIFSHFTKERLTFAHPNSHSGALPRECKDLWGKQTRRQFEILC